MICKLVAVPTAVVDTVKFPEEEPAGMMMLAGTVAATLLLARVTRMPPAGATLARLTVPVELAPLSTVAGERETPDKLPWPAVAALMVKPAETVFAEVAVMLNVVVDPTAVVVTVKLPLLAPAAMVRLGGTVAAALLLVKVTNTPPSGAAVAKVTVPVELAALATVEGESVTPAIDPCPAVAALIVNPAVAVFAELAVIVSAVVVATALVVTGKVPELEPAAIVRLAGTVAAGLLLANVTRIPPIGAAVARVTVPVALPPLATVAGDTERAERAP